MQLTTSDYLFMRFKTTAVPLNEIVKEYYPHLSKLKMLEKARMQAFPFTCFRLDASQKAPYFAHLKELAKVLDEQYGFALKACNRK